MEKIRPINLFQKLAVRGAYILAAALIIFLILKNGTTTN